MRSVVLIAHNLRSTHNVGSLLRTADGLGVDTVWLTGYTPYPLLDDDPRLPHIARKVDKDIHKTALNAEHTQRWQRSEKLDPVLETLRKNGYTIAALEQSPTAIKLNAYAPPTSVALIVGREREGVEPEVLGACDVILEIPMVGAKESFNVSVAGAIGLWHCTQASAA